MNQKTDVEPIKVEDLKLDQNNPRLIEFGISTKSSQKEILKILWEEMDVEELVLSMAASGYFPHEPLIAAKEEGQLVVIEGNRRLSALKVLTDQTIAKENKWKIPAIGSELQESLREVPVIIQKRQESWRYLGFKHVNGPAKWTSFAKAEYVAQVKRKYGISLSEIASQIGDGHGTVQKLYRGLMVLEQAEREGTYNRKDRKTPRIFFSHLYTSLEYDGFSQFLQLSPKEDEGDSPVALGRLDELGEVCRWLFGSKQYDQEPLIKTQNPHLKQLDLVLKKPEALAALRAEEPLSKALELTYLPEHNLEQALLEAKRALMKAKSYVPTGYDKSESLLKTAGTVANIADAIYTEMDQMLFGSNKKRLSED